MKQVEKKEIIEMEGDTKDETLPPGFRFHPSDEELITYYLVNKISDSNFTGRAIVDVDLNKSEPWDLPGKAKMGENEWYFFNLRDRKYPTGVRTNRATNIGYWKTTGKDKEIFNNITSELIGMKKTLVFYRGRAPRGEKTNWIIHEYRIPSKSTFKITKDEWVVCRVFQKSAGAKRFPTSSSQLPRAVNVNPPYNFQFPTDQLAELTSCASTSVNNLPIQSPMNYVPLAGGFTVSGLNLNFGGATTQPLVLPPQAMNQQDVIMTSTSYAADQFNQANATSGSRYMSMEHCMDLDGYYWPPY